MRDLLPASRLNDFCEDPETCGISFPIFVAQFRINMKKTAIYLSLLLLTMHAGFAQEKNTRITPGAERLDQYLNLLKGKSVGIFANQTSMVGNTHLVDTLLKKNIKIKKIFSPEHGFRGTADAGEHVNSSVDKKTGIAIVSLYGDHRKATAADLAGLDVLVFDIQDVGLRYYTFISSLQEYMESAIASNKPLIILDRPNPNGFYVDGPVLEDGFQSFVGMQPVPVVYGMTPGEYANMLLGEKWLAASLYQQTDGNKPEPILLGQYQPKITVIPCANYTHHSYYELPVKPSPNLPNMQSVLLYSSTCYFEGTEVSLGRGTSKPFQVYGHPSFPKNLFSFTPVAVDGAKNPPLKDKLCYGYDLSQPPIDITKKENQRINLSYLLNAYKLFPNKDSFFIRPKKSNPKESDYFFNKLTGNYTLMVQIMNGKTEDEIRASWQPGLTAFKKIRKKYLLYEDFE